MFSAFTNSLKIPELRSRIFYTLSLLFVSRVASIIPLPGIDPRPLQNFFAEQLKGVQAAVMARSSELNGVLSTDHPFEYLGGLALAVRHLDGASPSPIST